MNGVWMGAWTRLRWRLSGRLHHWAVRLYDDWHENTLTHPDGSKVTFCCYWQWTGGWPESYEFDCDCKEKA